MHLHNIIQAPLQGQPFIQTASMSQTYAAQLFTSHCKHAKIIYLGREQELENVTWVCDGHTDCLMVKAVSGVLWPWDLREPIVGGLTQHFRGSIPSNALGICCRHILPLEGDIIYKCVCPKYQKCECFFVFTPNYFSTYPEPLAHSLEDPFMVLHTYITYLILCTVHGDQGWGTGRQRRLTRRVGMLLFRYWPNVVVFWE